MAKSNPKVMLVVILASNLLASFTQSIMNIALDQVATDFHVSLSMANWMVLGFTIVAATMITTAGSLLKRFGIRKVMAAGYLTALAGSLLGLFADSFAMMFAARLIQAFTVGLFFPTVSSVIMAIAPKGKSGTLLALNSGVIGFALALTPLIAGLFLTEFGLRSLFVVPAVLSVVLLVIGYFFLYDVFPREDRKVDPLSIVLSFAGLGLFIYGLNEITRNPLSSSAIMAGGIIVLGLFAWRQLRIPDPLLDLTPLKHLSFASGEVIMMVGYMGSIFMSLLVPLYLEGAASFSAFITGALMIAPILCYAISCLISGKIEDKHGIWPLVPIGFLLLLVGFLVTQFTSAHMLIVVMMVALGISYAGIGLLFPALKAHDLQLLPQKMESFGSSIHSTLVQIAGSIGSALFVGIMSADVDRLMAGGIGKADAYASGFSFSLAIGIGVLAVGFVGAIVFSRVTRRHRSKK